MIWKHTGWKFILFSFMKILMSSEFSIENLKRKRSVSWEMNQRLDSSVLQYASLNKKWETWSFCLVLQIISSIFSSLILELSLYQLSMFCFCKSFFRAFFQSSENFVFLLRLTRSTALRTNLEIMKNCFIAWENLAGYIPFRRSTAQSSSSCNPMVSLGGTEYSWREWGYSLFSFEEFFKVRRAKWRGDWNSIFLSYIFHFCMMVI